MLIIPEGVSEHLKKELEQFQSQIRILLRNHQILSSQAKQYPEDLQIQAHLKTVQNYLLKFSREQKPVIEQIRAEVKSLNLEKDFQFKKESAEENYLINEKSQLATSDISKSPGSAISGDNEKSHCDTSDYEEKSPESSKPKDILKDRMAFVRAMRRKKKKPGNSGRRSKSSSVTRTPSPKMEESGAEEHPDDELGNDSLYPGHIVEVQKFSYSENPKCALSQDDPIERPQTVLQNCDREQFLLNLGLLTPNSFEKVVEHRLENRKRTFDFRNLTYVPEISDKKHRISYNYLSADLNSPPLLRTRQRRPPLNVSSTSWIRPMSSKNLSQVSRSASMSRGSTPEADSKRDMTSPSVTMQQKMQTESQVATTPMKPQSIPDEKVEEKEENKSEVKKFETEKDKNIVQELKESAEKCKLEKELSALEEKSKEIESALGQSCNRRTVATRKERTRLSDLQVQKSKIETEKNSLRKKIENLNSKKTH